MGKGKKSGWREGKKKGRGGKGRERWGRRHTPQKNKNLPLHYCLSPSVLEQFTTMGLCRCTGVSDSYLNSDNPTCLFAVRVRQKVAHEILARTVYGNARNGERGIDRLLDDSVYSAAFPLHDVRHQLAVL